MILDLFDLFGVFVIDVILVIFSQLPLLPLLVVRDSCALLNLTELPYRKTVHSSPPASLQVFAVSIGGTFNTFVCNISDTYRDYL